MTTLRELPFPNIPAHRRLYDEIAKSHPSLMGGRVFCPRCKTFRTVDPAKCLQHGWPKCCGATMSIDNAKPETK